ncbi:MAG: dethiobiotin synthase [Solirubrobacteraceae bacterium]
MAIRGCLVTGTDTGAGKTIVTAALCAAMRAAGERVAAHKPVVTGVGDSPQDGEWPRDHELLAAVTAARPEQVCARTFAPSVSPHLAAELAGVAIELDALVAAAHDAAARADVLVVEGVGGLLVPLGEGHCVRDLAVRLGLPLVIAARPGLGTINHTLLTIEAARAAGLQVRAVVLTPWPETPTVMQLSNRETIARLGDVSVATLAPVAGVGELEDAAAALPWRAWLGSSARPR